MDEVLEFKIAGSIYSGKDKLSLDEFNNKFIDFIEANGWKFCGVTAPLEDEE